MIDWLRLSELSNQRHKGAIKCLLTFRSSRNHDAFMMVNEVCTRYGRITDYCVKRFQITLKNKVWQF